MSLSDALEFCQARSYPRCAFVRLVAFEVGVDVGGGDANGEGYLQGLEVFACEEDNAGEVLQIAFDGC